MRHGLDVPSVYVMTAHSSDIGVDAFIIGVRGVARSILVLLGLWRARAGVAGAEAFGSSQLCSHCEQYKPYE